MKILRRCQDKQEWNDYILEHGGHPLQLWGWGDLKSIHGWVTNRLFLVDDDDGEVFGAVQILVRKLPLFFKSLVYVPRWPVVDEANREDLLNLLSDYVKVAYRSVAITIEPDSVEFAIPEGWVKSKNHVLPSKTIILDLTKSESELLKTMEPNTRRYIRRANEEAILIKKITNRQGVDDCLSIYKETSKRAGFNLHKDQYYYDILNNLEDYSSLFVAYYDNQPVAFLWLAISAETAFELYGGMTEVGRKIHASYALKWHAICKSKEWELNRYDFGGLVEGGVTAFKLSWASSETELAGTFDRPLSPFYGLWSKGLPAAKKVVHRLQAIFKK